MCVRPGWPGGSPGATLPRSRGVRRTSGATLGAKSSHDTRLAANVRSDARRPMRRRNCGLPRRSDGAGHAQRLHRIPTSGRARRSKPIGHRSIVVPNSREMIARNTRGIWTMMHPTRLTKNVIILALIAVAVAGWLASRSIPEVAPLGSSGGGGSSPPAAGSESADPPNAIRTTVFRDRHAEPIGFRVLDVVTARPLTGVTLCGNADGTDVYSRHPTTDDGRSSAELPDTLLPPCRVFIKLPPSLGGATMAASFPKSPDTDIMVPLFARIVVQTTPPKLLSKAASSDREVGYLWCVSWPAPQDAFKTVLDDSEKSRLSNKRAMMGVASQSETTKGAVDYHDCLRGLSGCDESRLICIRHEVQPGQGHSFDLAYAGDVLVSYYMPWFPESSKIVVQAVPGTTRNVTLPRVDARWIRIKVENDRGDAVADARVVIVDRRDLEKDDPHPDNVFFVFTPQGTERRISVRRRYMTSNLRGEVDLWAVGNGVGEMYVSATKAGHVGAGHEIWSGIGVPDADSYKITLKCTRQECVVLTYKGRPVANCERVVVTDLHPTSLLGQIEYPLFSTGANGEIYFEQLIVGKRYGIVADTDFGSIRGEIRWTPGVDIDLH